MKKVLFCAYNLDVGGIENALINLLNNFNYDKYDVTLILEKKEGIFLNRLNKKVKVEEYKVSESKNILLRKFKNLGKRIIWLIKNYHKYDFSCCYATYSLPCNVLSKYASKNNLFYIHSNYSLIYDSENLKKFFDERKIEKYKNIAFVSNESREDLIKYYPSIKQNSYVINNLVNYEKIEEMSNEKIEEEKTSDLLFVFVGRLEEHSKKISRMISVISKIENAALWIIGDGKDRKKYENMIKNISNVKLLGLRENPYPYIKCADYVILTSDYEGFPVVYNEAIVLNTPIITTLNLSDDYISIKDRFGYIVSKDENAMLSEIKNIIKYHNLKMEKVDFKKINSSRIEKIESLIEGGK